MNQGSRTLQSMVNWYALISFVVSPQYEFTHTATYITVVSKNNMYMYTCLLYFVFAHVQFLYFCSLVLYTLFVVHEVAQV